MTNPLFPFSRLNRIAYSFAINKAVSTVAESRLIQSIYLRHGLTRDDWVPGLSDIDFTVGLKEGLCDEESFDTIRDFVGQYRARKKWLPMLGEVEVLCDPDCNVWTRHTIRGAEVADWILLYGEPSIRTVYTGDDSTMGLDRLAHGCWIYEGQVTSRFYEASSTRWIESKSLRRIARKALRYTQGDHASHANLQCGKRSKPSQILVHLLEILGARAGRIDHPPGPTVADTALLCAEGDRPLFCSEKYQGLRALDSVISAVILSFSTSIVVLRGGLSRSALENGLDLIRAVCRANDIQPRIFTPELLEYYLRVFRPILFLELCEYRHILFGQDSLPDMMLPDEGCLAADLLQQSLNIMLTPARVVGAFMEGGHDHDLRYIEVWIGRAWQYAFLLLYLDTGQIGSYDRSIKAVTLQYPELAGEIDRLKNHDEAGEAHARAVHSFARRCARHIHEKMNCLDTASQSSLKILGHTAPDVHG